MSHTINKQSVKSKQQGMALVMALIMLLLITILGVSSVRMSSNDTQISGNSIYSVLVFQGAESALSRSTSNDNHFNLIAPATNRGTPSTIAATNFPAEDVIGGGKMNSSGTIEFEGILNGPVFNSFANSSEFNYQVFRVSAQSSLAATAARDRHTEGRAVQIPKP